MSTVIIKNSTVSGKVPLPSDLVVGELALNVTDKKLFIKQDNSIVQLGTLIAVSSTAPSNPTINDLWIQI